MNSARFAKAFKALALSVALGTGLTVSLLSTTNEEVVAEDALPKETSDTLRDAVAEFNRGNYTEAAGKFRSVMVGMPVEAAQAKSYLTGVREFVPNDTQRKLVNLTGGEKLQGNMKAAFTTLQSVGVWLANGRTPNDFAEDVIFGRRYADPKMGEFIQGYMTEDDALLRNRRSKVIAERYGEFAVMTLFNDYLAKNTGNRTDLARVQSLLVSIGSQCAMPLIQAMNYKGDNREAVLTPVLRVLGRVGSSVSMPALKEELENETNSEDFRKEARIALNKILSRHNESGRETRAERVSADAQTLWYLQANGWYLNDAVGGYGPTYNKLVGSNFAGNLPTVTDDFGLRYAVWHWDSATGGINKQIVPSWIYADTLAEYAAAKAVELSIDRAAQRGDWAGNEYQDPFVMDAMALQTRIDAHQYASANARLERVTKEDAAGTEGVEAEKVLIDSVMRGEGGLIRTGHLWGLAAASGPSVLMHALNQSLDGGYPEVTIALCDALLKVNSFGDIFEAHEALNESGEGGLVVIEEEEVVEDSDDDSEDNNMGHEEGGDDNAAEMAEESEEEEVDEEMAAAAAMAEAEERRRLFLAPLMRAVQKPHEQVRYAAARALVGIAPDLEYPGMDATLSAFGAGLRQRSLKNIIVIASDESIRTNVRSVIEDGTTFSIVSYRDVTAGVRQLMQSPIYDAVIISAADAAKSINVYSPDTRSSGVGDTSEKQVDSVYRLLLSDVGTRNIPRIFIGKPADLGANDSQELKFVDSIDRKDELVEMVKNEVGEESGQDASNAFVIECCKIVQGIDPNNSELDINRMIGSLAASLGSPDPTDEDASSVGRASRSTMARIELAKAISHLVTYEGLSYAAGESLIRSMRAILGTIGGSDGKDTADVRAEVCQVLGEVMRVHKSRPEFAAHRDEIRSALEKCMRLSGNDEATINARNSAGANVGKIGLSARDLAALRERNRLRYHKADNTGK